MGGRWWASFPFLHGNALAEAGHEVQIFLLGEGVGLNPLIFVSLTEWCGKIITE